MFREKVTVQDAIVAVSLVESSMQGSALIGGIDALHTSFPYNPMEEYRVQGEPYHQRDNLYVVHPHCVYAIDGGVGLSNTTELSSVLYWFCDDMFQPRKAIFRSVSTLQKRVCKIC
jgi:hypothetical protein